MKDANPRLRIQAIRASETLYKAGDKSFADDYRALTKDPDPNVAIQAMLTVNLFKLSDAADVIKAAAASNHAKGVALVSEHLLAPSAASLARRGAALSPEEETRYQKGSDIFGGVCFSCHGTDGRGTAMEGAAAGTMLAPPLAGSPRVQGHRDYVIKVLLKGLTGPIEGKTYKDVMVPMGQQDDEWVAAVASYVRNSFGNSAGMVTPADVARVRAETAARKTPWTVPELEASLPRLVDSAQLAFSASHDAAAAAGAATLRGWTAGAPQAAGQWVQIELQQPSLVTELQIESTGTPPGSPRAFRVQTSTDGRTWSRPVAEGTGTGARTTIRFAPTRAAFVRVTLTDAASGGPVWSIRNLRVYQAPPR
jgi:mono/diheme cytochrome c family protein